MTDNKLTNEQIIKALEICNSLNVRCGNGCPYYEIPYKNGKRCSEMMIDDTLDLIKRQQAEIKKQRSTIKNFQATKEMLLVDMKRLKKHNKEYGFCNMLGNCLVYSKNLKDYNDMRKGLKSEAIKKFAEKLHKLLKFYYPEQKFVHAHIDNLVKEMTE